MIPKHKTIICEPKEFDEKYKEWIVSLNILPSQIFHKIDIKHENNNHYILYVIEQSYKKY